MRARDRNNLSFRGFWKHLPLYVLTRFTGDPHTMQVLQWLVAVTTFALLLFRSPFPVAVRVALVGGYFFAFEYSVTGGWSDPKVAKLGIEARELVPQEGSP